jgi:hypothetical protein
MMTFIDALPLWLFFLLAIALVLLSIEVGWRLGHRQYQRLSLEDRSPISVPVGALMGLLAFLLAFTFGMAATRFDNRKQIVMQEANAIGTTYLRTSFLPESSRPEMQQLLREYAQLRSGGLATIMSEAGMAQAAAIQDRLWSIVSNSVAISDTVSLGLFAQSVNEVIDLDTERVTAHRNRIPDSIWVMLAIVATFSFASLGYEFGLAGERSRTLTILMTISFIAVITLIADLDRAQTGLLQVSQQPLLDLLQKIGAP